MYSNKTVYFQSPQNITYIGCMFYVYISRKLTNVSAIIGIELKLNSLKILVYQINREFLFHECIDNLVPFWYRQHWWDWASIQVQRSMFSVNYLLLLCIDCNIFSDTSKQCPIFSNRKSKMCLYLPTNISRTRSYFNMHMDNVLPVSQYGNPFNEWDTTLKRLFLSNWSFFCLLLRQIRKIYFWFQYQQISCYW